MSTSPYSADLRAKVIQFIQSGKSQKEASIVFCLNKMTVNIWYLRYQSEGHCLPKKRLGAKPSIERETFIHYVNTHSDARAEDIAAEFGLSRTGANYWLKKLGFSYKKKPSPIWKQVKKSETVTTKS